MTLMQEAVRISDRFIDPRYPDCLDKQERLISCMMLVSIFYAVLSIGFVKMSQLEALHRREAVPMVAIWELTNPEPPPVPQPAKAMDVPPIPTLVQPGIVSGGKEAATPSDSKRSIPSVEIHQAPLNVVPKPVLKRVQIPAEAPVNVVSTKDPAQDVPAPKSEPAPTLTAVSSPNPTAGAPDTNAAGINPAGKGKGGEGKGSGISFGDGKESLIDGAKKIAVVPEPKAVAMGDLWPYHKRLLHLLAENLTFTKTRQHAVLLLQIDREGHLINAEAESADSKKSAKEAIEAAKATTFDPLPGWYNGQYLIFKIELTVDSIR